MNSITRIVLSLALITLIAQPLHAATYTDHAKKAAKIALYVLEIGVGSYFAREAKVQFSKTCWALKNTHDLLQKEQEDAIKMGINMLTASFLLHHGIMGLKKEICPNFNPIAWVKNKFNKKSEQAA